MEQLLSRILARPGLQQARMTGSAVRGRAASDPAGTISALAAWSTHPSEWVRIAAGCAYAAVAASDRDALSSALPFLERLANDEHDDVRRHGAQAAIEHLWLVHTDAVEEVAVQWMRSKNDTVREVLARAFAAVAVGGQIRRPSILRRFIERGLAVLDVAVPGATPRLRAVLAETLNEIGCLAPDLVAPALTEWSRRDDLGSLRLVQEIARLPLAALCGSVDFGRAAERLREQQALTRVRAARWVRHGEGAVEYPQVIARELIVAERRDRRPWSHVADPYRGCQLRCEFCNTRSLSEWIVPESGEFARRVTVVRNAAEVLLRELKDDACLPRDRHVLGIGAESDPYQPAEERTEVVREMLKVCLELGHPVVLQTRQALVTRDLDVLEAMAEQGLVNVLVATQTAVEGIRNKVELGTSTIAERFRAIEMLARKDVPVGLLVSPVMPELTDDPDLLDETMRRGAESGASWAVVEPLDLRGSAGVKARLFLGTYVESLLPRYDELYSSTGDPDAEWKRKLLDEVVPPIRERHGLDDVRRMLTSGRDAATLLDRR